ncbi:hypothetical protein X548_11565 [Stenotrophomonas maltophilia 5BA-I-2]|nr:hypothetical protein X548_11565 [Stenotrophomonas maltophilia 5BA-I-2]
MDRELCSRRGGEGEGAAFPAVGAAASCVLSSERVGEDAAGGAGMASQTSTNRVDTAVTAGAARLRRIRLFMVPPVSGDWCCMQL